MRSRLDRAYNIADLTELARKRLPRGLFEYIERGTEDEVTLRENRESIKRVLLRQRVGVDVSKRDASIALFGVKQSLPIGIAATGLGALIDHDGERKLACAAAAAGVPFTIGTSNFTPQRDILDICGDLTWRLIYPNKRREIFDHHLAMSRDLGIKTIVVTMDSAVNANREYLRRSGFQPNGTNARTVWEILRCPPWLFGTLLPYLSAGGFPEIADMPAGERRFWGGTFSWANLADDFTWAEVRAIRDRWQGNLVVKGLSTAEDARLAVQAGVDGIIVSNHGGRMLDGCIASFQALPEVVDAAGAQATIMVDGGFTRGADILKALALGAKAVFVGRATLFGLAAGGQAGVTKALEILRAEINRAMSLTGVATPSALDRSFIYRPDSGR